MGSFVIKCEGDSLVWNQYITKPKEKNVGAWYILFPLSEKVGGRVPHLIATMVRTLRSNHSCAELQSTELVLHSRRKRIDRTSQINSVPPHITSVCLPPLHLTDFVFLLFRSNYGLGREGHWDSLCRYRTSGRGFHAQAGSAIEISLWEKWQSVFRFCARIVKQPGLLHGFKQESADELVTRVRKNASSSCCHRS